MFQRRKPKQQQSSQKAPSRGSTSKKRSKTPRPTSLKQRAVSILGASIGLAAWYLTPISDLIVDVVIDTVDLDKDVELEREALRGNAIPHKTVYNKQWSDTINRIGHGLIDALDEKQYRLAKNKYNWDFGVIHADFVNAFCLPGGTIRVTDGLLQHLRPTEGELAALLGHEIGHVLSRHAQKRLLNEQFISYMISTLTYEDGDDDKETFGQALGELIVKSSSWLGKQKFSRRDEYQADAVAWDLLFADKRNPRSLEGLLGKLQRMEKKGGPESVFKAWSKTHPATADRVEAVFKKWYALPEADRTKLDRLMS